MRKITLAAAAALAIVSTAAFASVSFDYGLGTGFVGKGDVTTLYGWNNAQATQYFTTSNLGFYTQSDEDFTDTCSWNTGQGTHVRNHHQTHTRALTDSLAVDFKNRTNRNGTITGINLTGYNGSDVVTGDAKPNLGDACLDTDNGGNGVVGTITDVTTISTTDPLLYVRSATNGVSYPLPNTVI
jgi:hypothetical protein